MPNVSHLINSIHFNLIFFLFYGMGIPKVFTDLTQQNYLQSAP